MKYKNLKQQLDSLAAEGKEIKVTWDGGNDSGSFNVFINDKELSWTDELSKAIIDAIESEIDYGSWAGDFYADGEVYYSATEGAFVGEGKEVTTEYDTADITFEIRIPKALNFDRITIDTEGGSEYDELRCQFRLIVNNGPVFEEHVNLEEHWKDKIETMFRDFSDDLQLKADTNVEGMYNDWIIQRDEMIEDGDDLVHTIDDVGYSYGDTRYQQRTVNISEDECYEDTSSIVTSNPPS